MRHGESERVIYLVVSGALEVASGAQISQAMGHLSREGPGAVIGEVALLGPQVKREAVGQLISKHQMSGRHACRLVGLSRGSHRNAPVVSVQTEALKAKIVEIAHARRRFGYRRVHDLLRLDQSLATYGQSDVTDLRQRS